MTTTDFQTLTLLIVEDNPADSRLIQEILLENNQRQLQHNIHFEFVIADTLKKALALVKEMAFDLILLDLSLPDSQHLKSFDSIHRTVQEVPIVILSGLMDEALAVEAMQHGAQDYLLKSDILNHGVLIRALRYARERHRLWLQLEEKKRQLEKSEKNRRQIIEKNADGIIIVDKKGYVKFVNPAAEDILRNDLNNMLAKPLKIRTPKNGTAELTIERRRGGEASVELRLVETEWQGEPVYQASLRDITDHKEVQNKIAKKANELAIQNIALDEFAHTMAHQVQGLLSQIIGYASFIEMSNDNTLPPDTVHSLDRIVKSGNKMNNIINELLLLASMESQDIPLIQLNMNRVIGEIKKRLRFQLQAANVNLITQNEWPIPIGHEPWIEEALLNYVTNGIKYGGRPPHIEIGADHLPNGTIRIWVKDNGEGISEMDQKRLFKPHTRLRKVRARGEGLGLSIVKRIIYRCGGQVGVESNLGEGSTFWFTLPEATPADLAFTYESQEPHQATV
ncbi:MAG: ATP-binding protein [Chloroflexota bacterium]